MCFAVLSGFCVAGVPSVAFSDVSLAVDANAIAPSHNDSWGFAFGAAGGLDLLELGPLALGPHVRIGAGGAQPDLFWHGSVGARLSLDVLLVVSAAARIGVADLERAVAECSNVCAATVNSGTGALLEADLTAEYPLFGPLTVGARYGYSRILLDGEDYGWPSYGLQVGLRL
jgi:hypothetical protein